MKKTLLALTVAAVATSAQAKIELYKDDVKSVNLSGEAKVTLTLIDDVDTKDGTGEHDKEYHFDTSGSISFEGTRVVTEDITAFASFGIERTDTHADFNAIKVGVEGDFGKITGGDTGNSLGEVADMTSDNWDSVNELDRGIRYEKSFDALYLSADLQTHPDDVKEDVWNLGASYSFDHVKLAAAYSNAGKTNGVTSELIGVGAQVEISDLTLGAIYAEYEAAVTADNFTNYAKGDLYSLKANYQFTDEFNAYASGTFNSEDGSDNNSEIRIVGAKYAFNSEFSVAAEYVEKSFDFNEKEVVTAEVSATYTF
ncbi:porin [Vibrio ponticus]|uniref:Porin n=1 Tax=Vibrio ponticus TaxID=265668 RepID=A0A3N3DZY8_9VIBR|nr:porin [Vibrio ponticus]ROV59929.1 porin [Vibrio ponticus]